MVNTERGNTMTGWPDQPVIYEVNTAVWLGGLSRTAGRRLTLADVGATDWDAYYKAVPPTARLTRRYTSAVLLYALRTFGGKIERLVEFGGANSCFLEKIETEIAPRAGSPSCASGSSTGP